MSDNFKKEAIRQYLHYFRILFIITGIVAVIAIGAGAVGSVRNSAKRANTSAPEERVYDNADILTDEEEEKLRNYIAKQEAKYKADFVILTFSQPVDGTEALEYGCATTDWESNMAAIADDFWDEKGYGYNKSFEGDGSILIDNRFEEHRGGEWLSSSGKVEDALSVRAVEDVLYAVDRYYDSDPYKAYMRYIDTVCSYLDGGKIRIGGSYYLGALAISVVIAGVYAGSHLGKNKARDTTTASTYVAGGKPVMNNVQDEFIRKNVVKRHIETSSGGGGGGSHSSGGGGGHHTSSSGASHGGGGHRH
ncbi:MAG: TPM domain-containing protein [Firmicutes bacterium]|nr:TPM domain-containing protein [Bacillota bacterium]